MRIKFQSQAKSLLFLKAMDKTREIKNHNLYLNQFLLFFFFQLYFSHRKIIHLA